MKKLIIGGALGVAAVIAAFAVPAAANAGADNTVVKAAIIDDGHSFYTDAQIDDAWREATASFPAPLPSGVTFPDTAPAFFHPDDGQQHQFETALPNQIAAKYWRCAWLGQATTEVKTKSLTAVKEKTVEKNLTAAKWESLPDVAANTDVDQYIDAMQDYADSKGIDEKTAEYQLDCGVYTGE